MIWVKISTDMPLPMPRSVMSSPSHMITVVPAAMVMTMVAIRKIDWSGTTWLAEVLNHDNAYRYLFEPFRPHRLPLAAPFGIRRYLRPEADGEEAAFAAERILRGRVRSPWTDRLNRKR